MPREESVIFVTFAGARFEIFSVLVSLPRQPQGAGTASLFTVGGTGIARW